MPAVVLFITSLSTLHHHDEMPFVYVMKPVEDSNEYHYGAETRDITCMIPSILPRNMRAEPHIYDAAIRYLESGENRIDVEDEKEDLNAKYKGGG